MTRGYCVPRLYNRGEAIAGWVTLAEMETLVSIAGESAKKVAHFLTTGPPACVDRATPDTYKGTTGVSSVKTTQREDAPQTACHSRENDPESGHATRATNQHVETLITHVATKKEWPVFIPTSSYRNVVLAYNFSGFGYKKIVLTTNYTIYKKMGCRTINMRSSTTF